MNYPIDIQQNTQSPPPVDSEKIRQWARLALKDQVDEGELTILLVDEAEMTALNHQYRYKNKATNVLAFPANLPNVVTLEMPLLGDIVICPSVLNKESETQGTPLEAHWAHIIIHGVLHLLGYDHIEEDDAQKMQTEEICLLAQLNYPNPYQTKESSHE